MDKVIVSVLLPMYNTASFIHDAVASILIQTFPYFELIIIDDASTDNSTTIVENIKDDRIILIKKDKNSGYTDSINYGLKIAKGRYIARMDADDISMPERFEIQVAFLNKNPDVILCGSWFKFLNSNNVIQHPITNDEISLTFLEYNAIGHPTVMFRKDVFVENNLFYEKAMEPAEDYNLWVRAIRVGKFENIPKVLLEYRLHNNQISAKQNLMQAKNSDTAKTFHIRLLYQHYKPNVDITIYPINSTDVFKIQKENVKKYIFEFEHLNNLNKSLHVFNEKLFSDYCFNKKSVVIKEWFNLPSKGLLKYFFEFINPSTAYFRYFPNKQKLNIIIDCLNPFKW